MQGFAEVDGVVAAAGVLVAEDLDAEEADGGGDAEAVLLEGGEIGVAIGVEVHFAAANQLVKIVEGKAVLLDEGLEFAVDDEGRGLAGAGEADVVAPVVERGAAGFGGDGFVVGDIIDFAAEGVEGGHGEALGLGQKDEGEREVGGAFAGDGLGVLGHARPQVRKGLIARRGRGRGGVVLGADVDVEALHAVSGGRGG